MKKTSFFGLALVAVVFATVAYAAVIFDPATGTGFVGKGEVQTAFGWNNAALQSNASGVQFRAESVQVREYEWVCENTLGTQRNLVREQTTTTTGLLSAVARVRNQITGFNLEGYQGTPQTSTVTSTTVNGTPNTGANTRPLDDCGTGTLISSSGWQLVSSTSTVYATFSGNTVEL